MSRIAFVNNSGHNGWGGVENWTYKMANAFREKGHEIHIIARPESELFSKSFENNFNTKKLSEISSVTFINPFRVLDLTFYFKKNNIDAVFFCSSPTFKFATIAARIAGVKNIIYRRGSAKPIKHKVYNKILLNKISCFIANSISTKNKSLKYYKGFPENKIKLIYNGVNLSEYKDLSIEKSIYDEFDIDKKKLVLVNVGRLCRQKGQEYLIRATKKLKEDFNDFVLLLVGKGPKKEELKKLVSDLDLEKEIIFTGFRKDIPDILIQSNFMVHTALWEGCPWVVLEALAAGLPVLATDSSSLPEIICEKENGYLAEDKNVEDIAKKMLFMCKEANLNLLSKGARKSAEKRFNFNRVINETEDCFKNFDY